MKSEKSVEISKATLRLIWRLAQNIFPFHAALCKTVGGKWSANKLVFGLLGLTGTGSGGAFPETVLEGNFSQVLSHFLSLFCIDSKMRKSVQSNKAERCMTDADIFFFLKTKQSNHRHTSEEFTEVRFPFVQWSFPILVTDAH